MFDLRIPTVLLALLASTGMVPCGANQCNQEAIQECAKLPHDENESRCEHIRNKLDCMKKINGPCEKDSDENSRVFLLENSEDKSKQCDGMEEGECLDSFLRDSEKDIPSAHRIESETGSESDEVRKALCDKAKGKYESTLASMEGMKKKCEMKWAGPELDMAMRRIKETQAACTALGSNPNPSSQASEDTNPDDEHEDYDYDYDY